MARADLFVTTGTDRAADITGRTRSRREDRHTHRRRQDVASRGGDGERCPVLVVALLEAGAEPNTRTEDGTELLHGVAEKNREPAVATALPKAGVDPKARDEDGKMPFSPLHPFTRPETNRSKMEMSISA